LDGLAAECPKESQILDSASRLSRTPIRSFQSAIARKAEAGPFLQRKPGPAPPWWTAAVLVGASIAAAY